MTDNDLVAFKWAVVCITICVYWIMQFAIEGLRAERSPTPPAAAAGDDARGTRHDD